MTNVDAREQVERFCDFFAEDLPSIDADAVVARARGAAVRPVDPRPRNSLVAVAAALIAVVLVGGVTMLVGLGRDAQDDSAGITVSATTAVTTSTPSQTVASTVTSVSATVAPASTMPATTVADPAMPAPEMSWTQVGSQASFEGGFMTAISEFDGGLVSVGGTPNTYMGYTDAAAWLSADGRTWERVESESFTGVPTEFGTDGTQVMHDVVAGPFGIVGVGFDGNQRSGSDAAVWRSSDGAAWSRVADVDGVLGGDGDQVMRRVIVVGDRLLAVGESGGLPAAWRSTDGVTWVSAGGFDAPGSILDVTTFDDLVVAVGFHGDFDRRPAIWVSADDSSWIDLEESGDAVLPEGYSHEWGMAREIAVLDGGLLLIGDEWDVGLVWVSEDGFAWQALSATFDRNTPVWPTLSGLVVDDGRPMLFGFTVENQWPPHLGNALVFTTGNLSTWSAVLEEAVISRSSLLDPGPAGGISDATRFGDVLVGVGHVGVYGTVEDAVGDEFCGGIVEIDRQSCRTDAVVWIGEWADG